MSLLPPDLPNKSTEPAAEAGTAARPHLAPPSANSGEESPYKSTGGTRRIWNALHYSTRGLVSAWRVESAFRQELSLALILIPLALLLPLEALPKLALIASVFLVLIIELVNSSIEAAVDRISLAHHRLAGRAKDLGSAAVLLALILCGLTWVLIAGPVLTHLISSST